MIIGLAGQKESGKDTVAAYFVKKYKFERRAFADPLKRSVAALFDIPFHEVDQFKPNENVFVSVGYKNEPDFTDDSGSTWVPGLDFPEKFVPKNMWSPIREQTFREFLQRYGTESHRGVFGQDFWLDYTLPVNGYYPGRDIVLTDVRFGNERDRIKKVDGYVIEVKRPSLDSESDRHSSELIDFECDYNLYNDGALDDLWPKIEDMISWVAEQDDS